MADRKFFPVNGAQILQREICCAFRPNGTEAPTLISASSRGVASVARANTGKYTITLRDSYRTGLPPSIVLQHSSDSTDLYPQFGGYGNLGTASAATLTVRIKKGSANTDVTAASDHIVWVKAVFEESGEA